MRVRRADTTYRVKLSAKGLARGDYRFILRVRPTAAGARRSGRCSRRGGCSQFAPGIMSPFEVIDEEVRAGRRARGAHGELDLASAYAFDRRLLAIEQAPARR